MTQKLLPDAVKHLGLSSYAISSRSEPPNSTKVPKTSFFALFCTIYAHYACPFNCAWPVTTARWWEIFRTIIICNTELIQATKVKIMTKKLIFALFCTIYAHYAYLINYAWTKTSITCWETFRTTTICNIVLIRATKVEKKANVHMCTIYAHCLCMPI